MAHLTVADEQYVFRPEAKRNLFILFAVGVALLILGIVMAMSGGGHEAAEGEGHHASAQVGQELVASAEHGTASVEAHEHAGAEHHETAPWLKRLYTTLWMNNVYFIGLGIIGLFFVAIQYAAQAGWSAGIIRIPLAMGSYIPVAGILTLVLWFITKHDIFHWTHEYLYNTNDPRFDEIINKKSPFFYWPGHGGGFPLFYIFRMILFFGMWYFFFIWIKRSMLAEDLDAEVKHWYKTRVLSTVFLIFFGVSSSIAAWDWVMSIDTHWFSTMFGWYVFASWWVTALAVITLIVANLKSAGYLKIVNANHLHDLGKFVFAFSIFWTYIWFAQFLLIYYANIPEEAVYFVERLKTSPYSWIFYANVVLNFVLPFLLFMTRDAKRQIATLKLVCPIIIVGHWFDFYNMVTPAVLKGEGGIGFMEIGVAFIFFAMYLFIVLGSLAKLPLIGKNHPMIHESLHHHI